MAVSLTPEFIDGVVADIEAALEKIQRSQDSIVGLPGAELELLKHVEAARNFMIAIVRNHTDRTPLQRIFGNCVRISRIRAAVESARLSQMNQSDQRLRTCLEACKSVEDVLRDLGLDSELEETQERSRQSLADFLFAHRDALDREAQTQQADQCELQQHVNCEGAVLEAEARTSSLPTLQQKLDESAQATEIPEADQGVVLETEARESSLPTSQQKPEESAQVTEIPEADQGSGSSNSTYDDCEQHVLAACALENLAIEHDRLGKVDDAIYKYEECESRLVKAIQCALPAHPDDHARLTKHREDVLHRIAYLSSLDGSRPDTPVEFHIHPVQLDMCAEKSANSWSANARVVKNAAVVVAGSVAAAAIVSTGGFLVLGAAAMGATAMGATAAAGAAGAAGAGYCVTHQDEVDTVKRRVGDAATGTATMAKQLTKDLGSKITEAGNTAADTAAKVANAETAKSLKEKAKQSYIGFGAKITESGLRAKLAETRTKVAEKAGNFIEKGAERAAQSGDKLFDTFTKPRNTAPDGKKQFGSVSDFACRAQNLTSSFLGSTTSAVFPGTSSSSSSGIRPAASEEESEPLFDLRVEVLRAESLGDPEYRLGDTASNFLNGGGTKLSAVYVELAVGSKRLTTEPAYIKMNTGGPFATYTSERHLFAFRGEETIRVTVRDQRKVQSMVRGDPLVGRGKHVLDVASLLDMQQRTESVALTSSGVPAGSVAIRYQLLPMMGASQDVPAQQTDAATIAAPLEGSCCASTNAVISPPPNFSSDPASRPTEFVGVSASDLANSDSLDFQTPPSSPR